MFFPIFSIFRSLPRSLFLTGVVICGLAGGPIVAQSGADPLPRPVLQADPGIPSPAEFLGRPLESGPMTDGEILGYVRHLAQISQRVVLHMHGYSVEGRPLFDLVLGDPAHLKNLPLLKEQNAALSGLPVPGFPAESRSQMPVTVWLAGAVHGDEHSSAEALLEVAYYLAADLSEARQRQLRQLTVLIEPVQNPDGRARFLAHLQLSRFGDSRSDPEAWEHQQDWPGGRGNHFFFDLNRDWFFLTQPESVARAATFLAWRPQVVADFHEMSGDSTYYFAPPAEPVHPLVPGSIRKAWALFGKDVAGAMDRRGTPYFRREQFDLFYPGYGDSWPSLNGAVGMTFEQASTRGWVREAKDGQILTLGQAIGNHLTAALALLKSTASHRSEVLAMVKAQREGTEAALPAGSVQAVYIPAERFPPRVARLERRLRMQGIEVGRLQEPLHLSSVNYYGEEKKRPADLAAGTLVVAARGPAKRLVAALFAPDAPFSTRFLAAERERILQGRRGRIYDVTAWSLPLVMGLEAAWSRHPVTARLGVQTPRKGPFKRAKAAYLLQGGTLEWGRAVGFLLDHGVRVSVARRPLVSHGILFPPGAAVVRVPGNDAQVHALVQSTGEEAGVHWWSTDSFGEGEGLDLGSEDVFPLHPAPLAVLAGAPVSAASFGAVADLLVNGTKRPFTPLPLRRLDKADLRPYQVLVLPDGNAEAYASVLRGQKLAALKTFVQAGGVLVALKGAAAFCGGEKVGLAHIKILPLELSTAHGVPGTDALEQADGGGGDSSLDATRRLAFLSVPGAILRVRVDPFDPLVLGETAERAVPVQGSLVLALPPKDKAVAPPPQVVARYVPAERLHMAGLIWPEARQRLAGSPWLLRQRLGKGSVVLFAGDPLFRGAWDGLRAMFMNALLIEPARP